MEKRSDTRARREASTGADVGVDDEAKARMQSLGEAVRDARDSMSQAALGAALGNVPQTTISRWEKGLVSLTMEQVRRIEQVLDLPPGYLSLVSGYARPLPRELPSPDCFQAFHLPLRPQMLEALEAAATLGLGIRLHNQLVRANHDDEDTRTEEWVLELLVDTPDTVDTTE